MVWPIVKTDPVGFYWKYILLDFTGQFMLSGPGPPVTLVSASEHPPPLVSKDEQAEYSLAPQLEVLEDPFGKPAINQASHHTLVAQFISNLKKGHCKDLPDLQYGGASRFGSYPRLTVAAGVRRTAPGPSRPLPGLRERRL